MQIHPGDHAVEARLEDIHDGKILAAMNDAVRRVSAEIHRYIEQTKDKRCKGTIDIKLTLAPSGADDMIDMTCAIKKSIPERKIVIGLTHANGKILTAATQDVLKRREDEEQVVLFNFLGGEQGAVNPKTGEPIVERETAGSIAPSA